MLGGAADPPGRGGTPGGREQCCTAAQDARDLRGGAAGVDPCGEVTARGAAGGPRGFSPDRCLLGARPPRGREGLKSTSSGPSGGDMSRHPRDIVTRVTPERGEGFRERSPRRRAAFPRQGGGKNGPGGNQPPAPWGPSNAAGLWKKINNK